MRALSEGQNAASITLTYQASLHLPDGWKFGTALPIRSNPVTRSNFGPSRSPCWSIRRFFGPLLSRDQLTPGQKPATRSISPPIVRLPSRCLPKPRLIIEQLIAEATRSAVPHHYRDYHFLLTLSENVAHFGLEHHESSDDRCRRKLTDPAAPLDMAILLPHEYTHSWNGKYRRPCWFSTITMRAHERRPALGLGRLNRISRGTPGGPQRPAYSRAGA